MVIAAAWVLAFFLWVPAIHFWQFIVGKRTIGDSERYVQFLSNPVVIFVTAIAAFYLPVIIMVILYVQISRASRSRVKEDIKETESNKLTVVHSLGPSKIMEQNKNSIPNGTNRLTQVKKQNDKITGEMTIITCCQAADKDLPNNSTSGNMVQLNQADGGAIQGRIISVWNDESRFRTNKSELSIIKILGKCQKIDHCDRTAKIASGINDKNGNAREITAATVMKMKGAISRGEKVTRTILAILLAFIINLSPYFVMVLISTICSTCVPDTASNIGYWLVHINSTVNPACYALCNPTFKKTFKNTILFQYKNIGRA
ncbi:hypothetical protein scyTo_0016064 [Scyliorhinus torazame]|uniref:G-protein coupled receptors family 1 profile domain-containing protein n=1 Tax=Scyliorhinus torazame TaxID=75743 RepID=A0A401Q3M0_SCYTO|nr:hypothetical protein [Scyliorhinus torazame]